MAPQLIDGMRVLYLGDYDFAGGDIEDNTRRGSGKLLRSRVGTVGAHRGPGPHPQLDADHQDGPEIQQRLVAHEAVETEALSQRLIVEIVRKRLDELLPEPFDVVAVREEAERARLRRMLRRARG